MSVGVTFDLSQVKNEEEIYGVLSSLVQMDMYSIDGLEQVLEAALEDEAFLKAQLQKMATFYIEAVGLALPEGFEMDFEKICNSQSYRQLYQKLLAAMFQEWSDNH